MVEKKVGGIIETPFQDSALAPLVPGLLYYSDSVLTDDYYIKNVFVWGNGEWTCSGEHFMYVCGEVEEGDYLTTSKIRGAAIVTDKKELAFAVVTKGRAPAPDMPFPVIGGCYATFL